jgi:tetratricopeptide (TPR) repeat protein
MDSIQPETARLRRSVEWALRRAVDPATVLPMLHRLSRVAPEGTDDSVYALRHLAELLADQHPWRAALYAKRVLTVQPSDDGAWSTLALCHALLGHYRCAVGAYRRALEFAPANAAYAHNLGHLLDVALGRPSEALAWLEVAYERTGQRADVAVSFAHALGRAGRLEDARRVTERALGVGDAGVAREHAALVRWLELGAPSDAKLPALLPRRPPARAEQGFERPVANGDEAPDSRAEAPSGVLTEGDRALEAALAKGLASLPLDARQRGRARAIARDPRVTGAVCLSASALPSLAAAIAYAVVYADRVPLTQAEVAACFRVSVSALRGRFKALRGHLDLTGGGACVATDAPR